MKTIPRPTLQAPRKRRKVAARKSPRNHEQVEQDLEDTSGISMEERLRIALEYRDIIEGNSCKRIVDICKDARGRKICNRN